MRGVPPGPSVRAIEAERSTATSSRPGRVKVVVRCQAGPAMISASTTSPAVRQTRASTPRAPGAVWP